MFERGVRLVFELDDRRSGGQLRDAEPPGKLRRVLFALRSKFGFVYYLTEKKLGRCRMLKIDDLVVASLEKLF